MSDPSNDRIIVEGDHLRLVRRGKWEFAQRVGSTGVVGIVAVTEQRKIVLVEQFRIPVGCAVIELPAGLAGDLADAPKEALAEAARRELLEETGYLAGEMAQLVVGPSSAGMTDECVVLFHAGRLKRLHDGGGDGSENIVVHEVALDELAQWLRQQSASGKLIDFKIWAALALLDAPGHG